MFRLGLAVDRRAGVPAEPVSTTEGTSGGVRPDIDLIDRADRVRHLLEFVAGYAMLVEVCEDGATIDTLKMSYIGLPLLEEAAVVQELENAVWPEPDVQPESDEPGAAVESGGAA